MIALKKIKDVKIHHNFYLCSEELGYTAEIITQYLHEIKELIQLWLASNEVEIYTEDSERQWGRIKSMADNTTSPGAVPYYLGLFHSRVLKDENDPLLLISFVEDVLYIRMFTDHDDLFGTKQDKHDAKKLKTMKKTIANLLSKYLN